MVFDTDITSILLYTLVPIDDATPPRDSIVYTVDDDPERHPPEERQALHNFCVVRSLERNYTTNY